ncbi:MAG: hypothetical protein JNL98_29035 [Bryobacterales bacterium]|nr:hypothetical protein [Bryobacterales bacterium]
MRQVYPLADRVASPVEGVRRARDGTENDRCASRKCNRNDMHACNVDGNWIEIASMTIRLLRNGCNSER